MNRGTGGINPRQFEPCVRGRTGVGHFMNCALGHNTHTGQKTHHPRFPSFSDCENQIRCAIKKAFVTIDFKLKFKKHSGIVFRANQRKSLVLRCSLSRNPIYLVKAFKTYVRPLLDYSSTISSPSYVTEIITIGSV